MNIAIVDDVPAWWSEYRLKIKDHPLLSTQYPRINNKMQQGSPIVFRFGASESKADGYVILTAAHLGVIIELVYAETPFLLQKYFNDFVRLMKKVNYGYVYANPVTESRRRLYQRFGFVGEKNMMVMRVK